MDFCAILQERFPQIPCERDFPFAKHTTIGCGGIAAAAVCPSCVEELAALLSFLKTENISYCFLGAGANVLPADGYWEGAVVRFCRMKALFSADDSIYAGAGVTGGALLRFARERGFGGFEPFAGIPMTVGGGCAMNAGIRDGHFSDLVTRVVGVEAGRIRIFTEKECGFSEKDSVFLRGVAIAGVYFRGDRCAQEQIDRRTETFLLRRSHLPNGRSMGCTFVNPAGRSAGELIERCGLKGVSIGNARVSNGHANFILNEGASASEVSALIALVKEEVKRKTGILLREEIRRIP